jgi:hypothetical protein
VSVDVPTPFGGTFTLRPFRKAQPHHHYIRLRIGPMRNRLFPYVVLSRALRYHHLILTRPHAIREQLTLHLAVTEQEESTWLTPAQKARFDACLGTIATAPEANRAEMAQVLQEIIEAYEGLHTDTTLVV